MPQALFETHLDVQDLEQSIGFYRDVVGLDLAYEDPTGQVAFFWIGGRGRSMLGLWSAGSSPNLMRLHTAFRTELGDVLAAPARLRTLGVEPLDFHGHATTEPSVICWMPAASVFFRDPDGHLLEFLAMLPDRPRPALRIVPYSKWVTVVQEANDA